jgi:ATP-dependent Zn protease
VLRFGFDDGEKGCGPVKHSHSRDINTRLSAFAKEHFCAWIIEGEEAARQLLSDNHKALKAIAEALLKNGHLYHYTVADIAKQHTTAPSNLMLVSTQ